MPQVLPLITPMRLSRMKEPFDSPDCIYELKIDGFRALAYLENDQCKFISRNGHEFRGFQDLCGSVVGSLQVKNAIIDGELCCLAEDGRSLFNHLMFRRGQPYLYAFDLLWVNGRDLRELSLLKRKQ